MWFWKYCSAIQHRLLPFPGSILPVTAPASTVEREWETAVFIFSIRSAKPELLSTLFLGNYAVISKCIRGYSMVLICKDLLSSGDCVSWKLPKLSFLANRVQGTVRQSTDSHVQVLLAVIPLPPHCLGRRSQWCTVSLHARTTLAIIFRSTSPSLTPK